MTPRNRVLVGDALAMIRRLDDASVDTVITSPPYFALRNYEADAQWGLEPHIDEWVARLIDLFDELHRVLRPTGSVWLNLGDSFSRRSSFGAPPKGLLLGPERLIVALADRGWLVRGKAVWAKRNPMPTSVSDRLAMTYEPMYHLVRSPRYFFDLDPIREPHRSGRPRKATPKRVKPAWAGPLAGRHDGLDRARTAGVPGHPLGKNPGDVWFLSTANNRDGHHAVFPQSLIEKPLIATCPEKVCAACLTPWKRAPHHGARMGELIPCGCGASTMPGLVLDPFFGSGTVGVIAQKLGRDWLGVELNPVFAEIARNRLDPTPTRYERARPLVAA